MVHHPPLAGNTSTATREPSERVRGDAVVSSSVGLLTADSACRSDRSHGGPASRRGILCAVTNRGSGWLLRQIDGETIAYDLRRHRAYCLGRIAAAVWREWDGRRDLPELTHRVSRSLGEAIDRPLVRLAASRLRRAGLIMGPLPRAHPRTDEQWRAGRRRALRGLGLGAGLTVISLVVPTPAQAAATCLTNGNPCSRSTACCSGCCNVNSGRCSGGGTCAVP
jgi:hypothetical protein